jgi:hypothetical protein
MQKILTPAIGILLTLAQPALADRNGPAHPTSRPASNACWDPSDAAYKPTAAKGQGSEIIDLRGVGSDYTGYLKAYIDAEPNPIPDEALSSYSVPGWIPNSPRHAIFNFTNTAGSPSAPSGPLTPYTDQFGYTWGYIAQIQNVMWPFDPADYPQLNPAPKSGWEAAALAGTAVPPGVVMYTSNNKNQVTVFTARDPDTNMPVLRYFVTDRWGNTFIMKSSNSANDTPETIARAFDAAVLPEGWRKSTGYLRDDLCIEPIPGGDYLSAYQEFRDSADSAYSQIIWGSSGWGVAQEIGYPMPMWTSGTGSRLRGTPGTDIMYGGPGNDVFVPNSGDDVIDGGEGNNVVQLNGPGRDYTVTTTDGTTSVTGRGSTKTLKRIQVLRFGDRQVRL